jgi:hypothetical protein
MKANMKKTIGIAAVLVAGFFGSAGCVAKDGDAGFQPLHPEACVALASSGVAVALSADWKPYLPSVRVCPLKKGKETDAEIFVVSIFVKDFYRDKPASAPWEKFPKPWVVNHKGEVVGKLEELYPGEDVGKMNLTVGRWQGRIPGEIRMHILHPGVAGDYDLPTLVWDHERKRYLAASSTSPR